MPVGITAGEGTIAVATREGQTVALLDEETGKPTGDAVSLPANGEDVTFADGSPVGDGAGCRRGGRSADGRQRADGDRRRCRRHRHRARRRDGLGGAAGSSKARLDRHRRSVGQLDSDRGGLEPAEVAAGDDALWVSTAATVRCSGSTPTILVRGEPFAVGSNPKGVVVDDGSVWVANTDAGTVVRLDACRRPAGPGRRRRPAAADGRRVRADLGGRWGWCGRGDRTRPTRASRRIEVHGSPEGVAIGSDQVWVTTGSGDSVVRIDPGAAN